VLKTLGADNVIGIYLIGSLSYGDFEPKRSDIDLLVITKGKLPKERIEQIHELHLEIEKEFPEWKERTEASYTPDFMLNSILPPKEPRPYWGGRKFWADADYGNEWIIIIYLAIKHGITLFGKDFKDLTKPVDIVDVQKACVRDFYKEWLPKIEKSDDLDDNHLQSYVVLNLCRILYCVFFAKVGSKKTAADWVKSNLFSEYSELILQAEKWGYGEAMNSKQETIEFIKAVKKKIEVDARFGSIV
jgi:hypothetical protein